MGVITQLLKRIQKISGKIDLIKDRDIQKRDVGVQKRHFVRQGLADNNKHIGDRDHTIKDVAVFEIGQAFNCVFCTGIIADECNVICFNNVSEINDRDTNTVYQISINAGDTRHIHRDVTDVDEQLCNIVRTGIKKRIIHHGHICRRLRNLARCVQATPFAVYNNAAQNLKPT